MLGSSDNFNVTVINLEVPIKANIHKPILATQTIGMDQAVGANFATNNSFQRDFGGIGGDLVGDAVASFNKTKHKGIAASLATSLASNAFGLEVGLIGLEFTCEGRLSYADLSYTGADALLDGIGAAKRKACQFGCISGFQIKRRKPHKLAKFESANFRTVVLAAIPNHFNK
jgi:hypothetical protein